MVTAGRPDLHVLARFLDRMAAPDAGEFTRSRLQRAVGLNYDLFRKYLDILLERGLVRDEGDASFILTAEGHRVRDELVAWLHDLFGGRI